MLEHYNIQDSKCTLTNAHRLDKQEDNIVNNIPSITKKVLGTYSISITTTWKWHSDDHGLTIPRQ